MFGGQVTDWRNTKGGRKWKRKSKQWETENWHILDRIVDQEKERTNKIYIFKIKACIKRLREV